MRTIVGALALGVSLSMVPAAQAQDGCCEDALGAAATPGAVLAVADDDEEEMIRQVEARLNEVLLVDETGAIVLRNEFKDSLPFPPARLQSMLQSFVELGEDGKIHLKNPAAIRPYLPMIRGFLSEGGMERLRKLRDLPPEERRQAMQRLFGDGAVPLPFGGPRGPRGDDEPRPRARPEPGARPAPRPARPRRADGAGGGGDLAARLERIEESVRRIEHMLHRMAQLHAERLEGHGEGHPPMGPRSGRHDGSGMGRGRSARRHEGGARRAPLERLRELFDRGGRDRGPRWGGGRDGARPGPGDMFRRFFDRGDEGRGMRRFFDRGERGPRRGLRGLGQLMERGGVWRDGIGKLRELAEPSDLEALGKLLEGFDPSEGVDMGKLMKQAQERLTPEETARLMEVFSEFLATPEGRALAKEVEGMVGRMEEFMHSPEGARAMERLQGLGERLGRDGGSLRKLEDLIRGRDKRTDDAPRQAREGRSSRERHAPRNPKAKLY